MGFTKGFHILIVIAYVSRDVASLATETNCDLSTAICTTPSLCQEGWSYAYKRCYRTVSTSAAYREAQSMCNLVKGYLPVIVNADEDSFIASAEGGAGKWIGLNDIIQENTFMWYDERKASTSYTNWGSNQPDDHESAEDCVEIWAGQNVWNDASCLASLYSICEMDLTPRQWYPRGHSMYLFNTRTQAWSYARDSCEDVGAHLVVISDSSENSFIGSMLTSFSLSAVLIGINDVSSEGTFVWHDSGETSTYTYWNTNEPSNSGGIEDVVVIPTPYYLWNDVPSSYHYASVCEKGIEWDYFNGKKYFATDYRLSASDAIRRCNDIGGYLAVISSDEENSFLVDMIATTHYSQREFYIGYISDSDATWSWPDSSEPVFSNWDDGEGLAVSACAALSLANGQWLDVDCSALHGFICEAEISWIPWHNEKYYINTTPLPYDKAREVCRKIGGDLVSYDTLEEQKVVESLMLRTPIITTKYKDVYIGNYKEDDEFKWARTGTTSSLSNWCSGEPSGGSEYCTEFRTDSSQICNNDISCSKFRASICEADLHPADGAIWEQRRYYVDINMADYSTSESRCNEMGMELMSMTSQYEMNIVLAAIALSGYSNEDFYIGYDDVTTEGTYVWKSGSAQMQGYEPWSHNSVFDDSNDCTILRSQYPDWHSVTCSTGYYHVCELEGADNYVFVKDEDTVYVDPSERNTCVEGHTLREMKVRSVIECMTSCLLENGCLSVNYYEKTNTDVTNCKLNDILRSDYPEDTFTINSCDYYEVK